MSAKVIVVKLASSGLDISQITVVRALHHGGLQGQRPQKAPLFVQLHTKPGLKFACEHLKHRDDFWKSVL